MESEPKAVEASLVETLPMYVVVLFIGEKTAGAKGYFAGAHFFKTELEASTFARGLEAGASMVSAIEAHAYVLPPGEVDMRSAQDVAEVKRVLEVLAAMPREGR
jgi:hypothetical protein